MSLSLLLFYALLGATIVIGSSEQRYPWEAPNALGSELFVNGHTKGNTKELLANVNTIALYFSAHWCPPCQGFTPLLRKLYDQSWKNQGIEIIFISSDRTKTQFQEYYKTMPWLASPYQENSHLSNYFQVQGIPKLVLLNAQSGNLIERNGQGFAYDAMNGKSLKFRIEGLKNKKHWNGKECAINYEYNTANKKTLASVKMILKENKLKPEIDEKDAQLKPNMRVIVQNTSIATLNGEIGTILEKKNEEDKEVETKYIVEFLFYISLKNFNLIVD